MLTPSKPLVPAILSRGLSRVSPLSGGGRGSRGYVTGILFDEVLLNPVPLLHSSKLDIYGNPRLVDNRIFGMSYFEVYRSRFYHPDKDYTGYGANGYWYTNGVKDPTHVPFIASWAEEGFSENRSEEPSFPFRILVVLTAREIVIFDADNLSVWMRFLHLEGNPVLHGPVIGGTDNVIHEIAFSSGYLLLAGERGLRIADFQHDRGFVYLKDSTFVSSLGLASRNTSTYLDAIDISSPAREISHDRVLSVSISELSKPSGASKNPYVVAAIGTYRGFDGLLLEAPLQTYPTLRSTSPSKSIAQTWGAIEETPGTFYSSIFTDGGSSWLSLGIREGDTILTDTGKSFEITKIDFSTPGFQLNVTPPLDLVSDTGLSYEVVREFPKVKILPNGDLLVMNGFRRLVKFAAPDWFDPGAPALFNGLNPQTVGVDFNAAPTEIFALDLNSTRQSFIATDIGVFATHLPEFLDVSGGQFGGSALLLYSEEGGSPEARYSILPSAKVEGLVIDPETQNLIVSCFIDEDTSTVCAINTRIHRVFKTYTEVGRVRQLTAYRNGNGPPIKEIE